MKAKCEELYIFWRNDFLTVARFAEYHGFTETYAKRVIEIGRRLNYRWPAK